MTEVSSRYAMAAARWQERVSSPYMQAYNQAYLNYTKTLADQAAANKAQAETFVTIASVMSTSVLMAAVASTPLRRLAQRLAISSIGMQNTRMVVALYAQGAGHPIVSFAFGKAVDSVKTVIGDKAQGVFSRLVQNTASGVTATDPFSRDKELGRMVGEQRSALEDCEKSIKLERGVSVSRREQVLADLRQSPFMNTPNATLNWAVLRPKIELGFYMQLVLDSDYLMLRYPIGSRTPPSKAGGISALPSSKQYPKPGSATALSTYTTVEVDRVQSVIREKIDETHKEVFGKPFYQQSWHNGLLMSSDAKIEEVVRAEKVLRILSNNTRPRRVDEVRVA